MNVIELNTNEIYDVSGGIDIRSISNMNKTQAALFGAGIGLFIGAALVIPVAAVVAPAGLTVAGAWAAANGGLGITLLVPKLAIATVINLAIVGTTMMVPAAAGFAVGSVLGNEEKKGGN